jgi:hypothetical protein
MEPIISKKKQWEKDAQTNNFFLRRLNDIIISLEASTGSAIP